MDKTETIRLYGDVPGDILDIQGAIRKAKTRVRRYHDRLTPKQAANYLGIHANTLHIWKKKGYVIFGRYPDGRVYYELHNLNVVMRRVNPTPNEPLVPGAAGLGQIGAL